MTEYTTWRWCFWVIVIVNAVVQVIAFFFLRETYAPRLLLVKARALRASTGNLKLQTKWEQSDADRTILGLLRIALSRPWVMLATQPIIQLFALYQAFNFGTLYLLISSFPSLFEGRYGLPRGDASLNYISLAVGSLIGVYICAPATDAVYARLKRRYGLADDEPGRPEFRVPLMIPVSFLIPCGILLYGWSAEAKLHWIVPNVSRLPESSPGNTDIKTSSAPLSLPEAPSSRTSARQHTFRMRTTCTARRRRRPAPSSAPCSPSCSRSSSRPSSAPWATAGAAPCCASWPLSSAYRRQSLCGIWARR